MLLLSALSSFILIHRILGSPPQVLLVLCLFKMVLVGSSWVIALILIFKNVSLKYYFILIIEFGGEEP